MLGLPGGIDIPMVLPSRSVYRRQFLVLVLCFLPWLVPAAPRQIITSTSTVVRVMAANLNGNSQKIEPFAIGIFQGLKPDIVAIQEFNYSNNSPAQIRSFVDTAFGTNFNYFRESGAGYDIPNGVISRYPFIATGSWDDPQIPNRGFAWARIDLPGTNDLYVVSVHLKASSGDAGTRSLEATALKTLIQSNWPSTAWIVVAGDMNLQNRGEAALATFRTFLDDSPIPADESGNQNTNAGRDRPYDVVLNSPSFTTNFTPVVIGTKTHTNGLVFDSRVYSELSAVDPVQAADSGFGQHMAVVKDFRIPHFITNTVEVPRPVLVQNRTNNLRWAATPGIAYRVERSANFSNWLVATQMTATSTQLIYTNLLRTNAVQFYRVGY
jgi:hypothetical protein